MSRNPFDIFYLAFDVTNNGVVYLRLVAACSSTRASPLDIVVGGLPIIS